MSNLRGSTAVSVTRPTTSGEGAYKLAAISGSRNGFANFYKGSRELKPTPMRTRFSIKNEYGEGRPAPLE